MYGSGVGGMDVVVRRLPPARNSESRAALLPIRDVSISYSVPPRLMVRICPIRTDVSFLMRETRS